MYRFARLLLLGPGVAAFTVEGPSAGTSRASEPVPRVNAERVAINDNRTAAGTLREGVLTVHLEVRLGEWHPDREEDPGLVVHAFAEKGHPLQVPGPLIRVPRGTVVHASIRNPLGDSSLVVHGLSAPGVGGTDAEPAYGYVLQEGGKSTPTSGPLLPGPTILLRRDEPVSITVVNELPEATVVHWHGIELESYYDGVAGFSGRAGRISPVIAPRDSFDARFTPPRAGTVHVPPARR